MFKYLNITTRGQVYLIVVIALTFTFTFFFILTSPIIEQAKNIVMIADSYQAFASAESGLERELFEALKPGNPPINFPPEVMVEPKVDHDLGTDIKTEITGKGKIKTQRSLFLTRPK